MNRQYTPAAGEVIVYDAQRNTWLILRNPLREIRPPTRDHILPALMELEQAIADGHYAAGFLTYETASAFDSSLQVKPCPYPPLWFGIYSQAEQYTVSPPAGSNTLASLHWQPSMTRSEYDRAISRIRQHLAQGQSYQVNLTYNLHADYHLNPWHSFKELVTTQPTNYAAYINLGELVICSASPELFFKYSGTTLESHPMKGTAPRSTDYAHDQRNRRQLHQSPKNRAENVMIVDMIRHDMGKIAVQGSVTVPELFSIEGYPTLWQMTSRVCCQTHAGISQILTAMFPCASITGAPKSSTMQLIDTLETEARGIYTGTIGFIRPDGSMQFNVAIRTLVADMTHNRATYGVGGGIVWDSTAEDEYQETLTKARIVQSTCPAPAFNLVETMLCQQGSIFLLEQHLNRLEQAANHFGFRYHRHSITKALSEYQLPDNPLKIRLQLYSNGTIKLEQQPAPVQQQPLQVTLAAEAIDTDDPFIRHKTTRRTIYNRCLAQRPGFDDVILYNRKGEITESCIANIVIEKDKRLLTPAQSSGLLPGTFRQLLLEQGIIEERIIYKDDLLNCDALFLINSVRRWCTAELHSNEQPTCTTTHQRT